jgi:hypothetical protein
MAWIAVVIRAVAFQAVLALLLRYENPGVVDLARKAE